MIEKVEKGAEFLLAEVPAENIFTPGDFDEQQQMIAQTCRDFLEQEIYPRLNALDQMEEGLMESLLHKAGDLGLLGVTVPEQYGGFGRNFTTGLLVAESIGAGHSFAVAFLAHTGIGTLPILYYGTQQQKENYLPRLAAGKWLSCYCLTEPEAGSDARAGKTRASRLAADKGYLLNGQKMWITNAGFADLFIVFGKIEKDETLSAFIVERDFGGISMNPEEKKMGIKGSSTRQVFFNDCPVPEGNLLADRGQGFKIAVNVLNTGRAKLCAAALGASKKLIGESLRYAKERVQFGQAIATFNAIRYKLAEMCVRSYAVASALYRTGAAVDRRYDHYLKQQLSPAQARLKSTEDFAIECAILKVAGSECLDYVVDEAVQIFGGMGYSAEGPIERAYRDARINRIFEGTNEINRLLTVDMLFKKAIKGELDLLGAAKKVAAELGGLPGLGADADEAYHYEKDLIKRLKKVVLIISGAALRCYQERLETEQELLIYIADIVGLVYLAESAWVRALRQEEYLDWARLYLHDAADQVWLKGKAAITSFAEGDEQKMLLLGLKRFTKTESYNTTAARRRIAEAVLQGELMP